MVTGMDISPLEKRFWLYSRALRLAVEAAATLGVALVASYLILRAS
jgi:hypothetical protein